MAGVDPDHSRQAIAALRTAHDELAALVDRFDSDDLRAQSGASEWTVADVLSHLGSSAEIGLGTLTGARPEPEAMSVIWDRWDAMTPEEKAASFLVSEARLTEALEAFDAEALRDTRIDLGFLPQPIDIGYLTSMRLSEVGLHRWDIDVAFNAAPQVPAYVVPFVLEVLPNFIGFFSKPIGKVSLVGVSTSQPDGNYALDIRAQDASLAAGDAPGATTKASMPAEAFLRLTAGRLFAPYTPMSVNVSGELSLDDLRRVFPGY
jgi:uncharacterized protein (TIGR03083 family)